LLSFFKRANLCILLLYEIIQGRVFLLFHPFYFIKPLSEEKLAPGWEFFYPVWAKAMKD